MKTPLIPQKDLLLIKAFTEKAVVRGFTYYDSHAKIFSIIRLPVKMSSLFPQIIRKKLQFEIKCFPNKEQLEEYIKTTNDVPLLLNLYDRDDGK